MTTTLDDNVAQAEKHLARFRKRRVAHLIDGKPDAGSGADLRDRTRRSTTRVIAQGRARRRGRDRSRREGRDEGVPHRLAQHHRRRAAQAAAQDRRRHRGARRRDRATSSAWIPASRSASCRRRRCAARRISASSPTARRTRTTACRCRPTTHLNYTMRQPIGPVGVITPWNTPFMLSTWKIAPALAAGCTVVHKPAEWRPLTAQAARRRSASRPGCRAGVLNIVHGFGEEAGKALTEHPDIKAIGFVGESATGSRDHGAGRRDAEARAFRARRQEPGHRVRRRRSRPRARCRGVHDLLAERRALHLVEPRAGRGLDLRRVLASAPPSACKKIKVGHPLDPATEIGPLIHPRHVEKVLSYIDVGAKRGRDRRGRRRPRRWRQGDGNYVEPTLYPERATTCGSRRKRSSGRC